MQDYSRQLAQAIKKARLELGLTQEQVAEKSGTDVRTIIGHGRQYGRVQEVSLPGLLHLQRKQQKEGTSDEVLTAPD